MTTSLDKVFSTSEAQSSFVPEAASRPFEVYDMPNTQLRYSFRSGNRIFLGTSEHTNQYLSGSKWLTLTPERVLAHELGHVYAPMRAYTEMGIVNRFENPIMRELGLPPRTCYPCVR